MSVSQFQSQGFIVQFFQINEVQENRQNEVSSKSMEGSKFIGLLIRVESITKYFSLRTKN